MSVRYYAYKNSPDLKRLWSAKVFFFFFCLNLGSRRNRSVRWRGGGRQLERGERRAESVERGGQRGSRSRHPVLYAR